MRNLRPPGPAIYEPIIERALAEDLMGVGDLTTEAVVPDDTAATADIRVRTEGRVAGGTVAAAVFALVDERLAITVVTPDGGDAPQGRVIVSVSGPAGSIFTAERTALNLLGRLCGIATATATVVAAVRGTGAKVVDTRKTTPGLRALEKYAVRCGGGHNHRFGLGDAVLIKDNHLAVTGGVAPAIAAARGAVGHTVRIEVEVDTLDQLGAALRAGADAVLLDNMDLDTLRRAVAMVDGRAVTEASGGITPDTIRAVAETGVDLISLGWLTHSAPSLDVGLDVVTGP